MTLLLACFTRFRAILMLFNCSEFCERPAEPIHGHVTPVSTNEERADWDRHFQVHELVSFQCNPGFVRVGPPNTTCTYTGWQPANPPRCIHQDDFRLHNHQDNMDGDVEDEVDDVEKEIAKFNALGECWICSRAK